MESRLPLIKGLGIYVPRDEQFGHIKMSDFLGDSVKSLSQTFAGLVGSVFDKTPIEFDTFQDVMNMYEGGIRLPESSFLDQIRENLPSEFLKSLLRSDGAPFLKFPLPDIIKGTNYIIIIIIILLLIYINTNLLLIPSHREIANVS